MQSWRLWIDFQRWLTLFLTPKQMMLATLWSYTSRRSLGTMMCIKPLSSIVIQSFCLTFGEVYVSYLVLGSFLVCHPQIDRQTDATN